MNPLLVSVVLPVYNGERFLLGALKNIQSQQYEPVEIIVVDDGSSDRTADIVSQFERETSQRVHYFYQNNKGPSAARNQGLKLAKGEAIAFLDVDDLWPENKLNRQVGYLAAHPDVDIVQGLIQRMQAKISPVDQIKDRSTDSTDRPSPLLFEPVFDPYPFINLGSCVYRRSVFDTVGLFDEALWDNEDTDWFTRAWELNIQKVLLPEVSLFYRKHDENMTLAQKNLVHYGLLKIYKRRIDRLRSQPQLAESIEAQSATWTDYMGFSTVPG
ncbi:glycosyltransferase family A protein [cf. Phormidesmis sp. LEGE 11477]|uniref:glycosyltransferase family 2 protein n=1 Tax=cf. Phormidesmis sp. LEGE 11477 TaxID=1828680 RepID=UPI001882B45C|nr:glycosyltransferase family A protein [cf. Phormidesmis sp. LEGE 11477]MBE9060368.1 glycosyltransferase family 2 protein [cf. Phormidesmis sp. LEGE 11477]